MGLINSAVLDNITSSSTIDASTVIGAFDSIYDVVNGGLDASNLASTFTNDASGVTIADSNGFLSATKASIIGQELTYKGWNSIHIAGFGSNGFAVFPGVIEHEGKYCTLSSRLNISGGNNIRFNTTSTAKVWLLTVSQQPVLTASDFMLIEFTGTDTADYDLDKNGWYLSDSASVSRRVVCSMRCNVTGTGNDSYFEDEYFQMPNIGHRYQLSNNEASGLGFTFGAHAVSQVYQIFDMDTNRYYYEINGSLPSSSNVENTLWSPNDLLFGEPNVTQTNLGFIGPSGNMMHHYYIQTAQAVDTNGNHHHGAGGAIFDDFLTTSLRRVAITIKANQLTSFNSTSPQAFDCGTFTVIVKRRIDSQRRI